MSRVKLILVHPLLKDGVSVQLMKLGGPDQAFPADGVPEQDPPVGNKIENYQVQELVFACTDIRYRHLSVRDTLVREEVYGRRRGSASSA